jgi:hypothetical protein
MSRFRQFQTSSPQSSHHIFTSSHNFFNTPNQQNQLFTMGSMPEVQKAPKMDLASPALAPVTPFNKDRSVDYAAIQHLGSWLASIKASRG